MKSLTKKLMCGKMKNKQNRSRSFSLSDVSVLPLQPQIRGLTLLRVHYCRVALSVFPASESNRNRIFDMFSGVFSSWVRVDLFFVFISCFLTMSDIFLTVYHFFFYLHQLNCSIIPCRKASNLSSPKNTRISFIQSFIHFSPAIFKQLLFTFTIRHTNTNCDHDTKKMQLASQL